MGVGGQLTSSDISVRETFPLFQETATVETDVKVGAGARIDVGGGWWIGSRFGAGARISVFRKTGELTADYTLPYPFLFNDHRRASATVDASQQVRDLHLQALWKVRAGGPWQVAIFGGPSITWLKQDLADSALRVTYAFPFDEIELTSGATASRPEGRAVGAHAGLSVMRRLSTRVGLDMELRWNHATVDLEAGDTSVAVDTGGLQVIVGFRFAF